MYHDVFIVVVIGHLEWKIVDRTDDVLVDDVCMCVILNILYFNSVFIGIAIYRVILYHTFLFIARCIVPNWRWKHPRKVYRIARAELIYVIAILHVDGGRVQGISQTARFLRESGRERRKGKLYSVGRQQRKKSHTRVYQIQRRQRRDGRVHARSPFERLAVDFIVDQIPTTAQNRDQRDQRWSYCTWFVTTNFMSRQRDRPIVPPLPTPPPRH